MFSEHSLHLSKGTGKYPQESYSVNWRIGDGDVGLPAAVLNLANLKENVNWMKSFAEAYGVQLCPHVKTTMCPKIMELQVGAGAWGLTTATVHQSQVIAAFGLTSRILMANQLVGRRNMEIVSELLKADPKLEYFALVDSPRNVEQIQEFFGPLNQRINVLVEIGIPDTGRTGVRNEQELDQVVGAIRKGNGGIRLRGIEFYEGLLSTEAQVREFCRRAVRAAKSILDFIETDPFSKEKDVIISGAGSAWFDVVAEELSTAKRDLHPAGWAAPLILLRPGCYVTHDIGIYLEAEKRFQRTNSVAQSLGPLKPALQVLGHVQSRPEPGLAIIGMGKRDVAIDSGFPKAGLLLRPNSRPCWVPCPANWEVSKVMDQHLFLNLGGSKDEELQIGDMIAFNISHPCNTFSAWRQILVVDDEYVVSDIYKTYF